MRSTTAANPRDTRQALAEQALRELLHLALQPGFYGSVAVEVAVQDGVIQHVRQKVDRLER